MDVSELEGIIGHFQSSRYAALASSCIIFVDLFLTFDDEVEYIWKAPWTPGKILFVLNRYYTLASAIFNNYGLFSPNLNNNFCHHFLHWQGYTGLISAMLSQMILQMRLYALYCMNRTVIIVITTFFILASAASATVMALILSEITVTSHIIPQYPFCVPSGLGDHFYAFWIPILAMEAMLCFMALYRGYLSLKEDEAYEKVGGVRRMGGRKGDGDSFLLQSGRKLIAMLIHDSVLYFLATFATYAANLIMFIAAPPTLIEIPIGFSVSIASVLSSRLILRVRHVRKEIEFVRQNTVSPGPPSPVGFITRSPSSFGPGGTFSPRLPSPRSPYSPNSPYSHSQSTYSNSHIASTSTSSFGSSVTIKPPLPRPVIISSGKRTSSGTYTRSPLGLDAAGSSSTSVVTPMGRTRRPSTASSTRSYSRRPLMASSPPTSPTSPTSPVEMREPMEPSQDAFSPAPLRVMNRLRRSSSSWSRQPPPGLVDVLGSSAEAEVLSSSRGGGGMEDTVDVDFDVVDFYVDVDGGGDGRWRDVERGTRTRREMEAELEAMRMPVSAPVSVSMSMRDSESCIGIAR